MNKSLLALGLAAVLIVSLIITVIVVGGDKTPPAGTFTIDDTQIARTAAVGGEVPITFPGDEALTSLTVRVFKSSAGTSDYSIACDELFNPATRTFSSQEAGKYMITISAVKSWQRRHIHHGRQRCRAKRRDFAY